MEWTKIKPQYFLAPLSGLTLLEHGALARLLALTAHLECLPDLRTRLTQVTQGAYTKLARSLQAQGKDLEHILAKVLEDVEDVKHKRVVSRGTTKRYREKQDKESNTCDASPTMSRDTTEKRREDKSIVEKRREENISAVADSSKSVSLKDIKSDLSEGSKHRLYNDLVDTFKNRGWRTEADFLKPIFRDLSKQVSDKNPREVFPYFKKALHNWINQNAEWISKHKIEVPIMDLTKDLIKNMV